MASFTTTAYKNKVQLSKADAPGFDPGNSYLISTDRQAAQWRVESDNTTESEVIADMITFAFPIVFGQEFEFGVYALAAAGKRSSSSVPGTSTSSVSFSNALSWAGTNAVLYQDQPLSSFTLTSGSGTDWSQTDVEVSAPAPLLLISSLLALLGYRRGV